jgi:hypothetical protein
VDLYVTYANGNCGTYNALIEANSPSCTTTTTSSTTTCTPAGTVIGDYCVGSDLYREYADGNCGSYSELIESNSPSCPTTTTSSTTTSSTTTLSGNCRFIFVPDTVSTTGFGLRYNYGGVINALFSTLFGTPDNIGGEDGVVYTVCSTNSPAWWVESSNNTTAFPSGVFALADGGSCFNNSQCEWIPTTTTSTSTTTTSTTTTTTTAPPATCHDVTLDNSSGLDKNRYGINYLDENNVQQTSTFNGLGFSSVAGNLETWNVCARFIASSVWDTQTSSYAPAFDQYLTINNTQNICTSSFDCTQ